MTGGWAAAAPAGWVLRRVGSTGSTNADLLAAAADGAPHGSVLVADTQTAGRGRLDRTWVTPPGTALALSVLLRPSAPVTAWSWLPLLAGLAVTDALDELSPDLTVRLKWPNDVQVGDRGSKAGGILCQSAGGAVVVGIGLNVTTPAVALPAGVDAASLAAAGAPPPALDRERLLTVLVAALASRYGAWGGAAGPQDPSGAQLPGYRERCSTLGRRVRVLRPDGELSGQAVDVTPDGALVLRVDADGRRVRVTAGDVVHLRERR